MKVFHIDRAILRTLEEDGTYTATGLTSSEIFTRCRALRENPRNHTFYHLGSHVLVVKLDGENFIIGYYIPSAEDDGYKIVPEAEQIMMSGESRALIVDDNGYIGIYDIYPDGRVSKFEYSGDDKLSIDFSELQMTMSDGGAKIQATTDILGLKHYSVSLRGRNNDMGSRYKKTIDATPAGMSVQTIVDVTPGMVRTTPEPATPILPNKISINHSPAEPLDISLTIGGVSMASISIDMLGNIEITSGPGAKIKLGVTGNIELNGITGITLTGGGLTLTDVLKEYMSQIYDTHVHPTPTGLSGPPIIPSIPSQIQLDVIKGI